MKVLISNQLEKLSDRLACDLADAPPSPLTPETVIVQSFGMAKWVSLALADKNGICANCRFPFPNRFLEDVFSAFIDGYAPDLSYDVNVLTWKIAAWLPELIRGSDFEPVKHYLASDQGPLKIYQLARTIALTFDQYLIFRPEMILAWEQDIIKDESHLWQARLWQKLVIAQGGAHKARLWQTLMAVMEKPPAMRERLPQRLSIFGISYLPPYHLEIYSALSCHLPVHFYYLNPSPEFWADIQSSREISRTLRRMTKDGNIDGSLFHLESGNPLLASWGKIGRDFFGILQEKSTDSIDLFEKPPQSTLLETIQSDIYLLRDLDPLRPSHRQIHPEDDSISIHCCHSPLREVEVLHDSLLSYFQKDERLKPEDILVMTPDIERYAPYIQAVFESREPKIPFALSDREPWKENILAAGLMSIIDLTTGRFTADDVLSVLDNAAVMEKFDMRSSDLKLIRHWISEANIRWGIDAEHRREFDLPAFSQNTWREGLNRMIAGVALDGRREELFAGLLPYGEIESDQTEVFGRFLHFWEVLMKINEALHQDHPVEEWTGLFQNILSGFFSATDEYRAQRQGLLEILDRMLKEALAARVSDSFPLSVIRDGLRGSLSAGGSVSRFLSGGVSFCAMLPMRSIPFQVIVLMGMDQLSYPRQDRKLGFSVLEQKRKPGDRSCRYDDQYLFLEAILSARRRLVVSYIGQDANDLSDLLPSVLVSELTDYIDQNYEQVNGMPASCSLVRKHHLHAFHPAYFSEIDAQGSFSNENYLAAAAMAGSFRTADDFLAGIHACPSCNAGDLTIDQLIQFLCHPARYFLQNCLGIRLDRAVRPQDDSEPFGMDDLQAYQIKQELVARKLRREDEGPYFSVKKAQGIIPVGAAGDYYLSSLNTESEQFVNVIRPYLTCGKEERKWVNITLGNCRLSGFVDGVYGDQRVHYRLASLKMTDYLNAWIHHLLINLDRSASAVRTTLILGNRHSWRIGPVENAPKALRELVDYFEQGQQAPLPFFPRASLAYAETLWLKKKTRPEALEAARKTWLGDDAGYLQGEALEVEHAVCFGKRVPLDESFEKVTIAVLGNLFARIEAME
jgi:exodeoxyribonuclease V gamma subunit